MIFSTFPPFTKLISIIFFLILMKSISVISLVQLFLSLRSFFFCVCLFLYNEALNPMQPETNPDCAQTWLCNYYYRMWTGSFAFTKISKYWTFQSEFKIQNWCKTCLKILVRHSSASGIWTNFWRNDPEAVKAFKFLRSVEWNSVIWSVQSTTRKYSGKAKCFLYARHFSPSKWHYNFSQ